MPRLPALAALLVTLLLTVVTQGVTSPRAAVLPVVEASLAEGATAQFFVILREQGDLSAAHTLTTKEAKGTYVYNTLYDLAQTSQAPLRATLDARGIAYQSFYIVNALLVTGDAALMNELAARPDVARLEANPTLHNDLPMPLPEPPAASRVAAIEPGVAYIQAPEVWALGYTGQGIVVGGQDTGYQWDHPALKRQYRGWDGSTASHNYNWHDSIHSGGGTCGASSPVPCDDMGHGTHTIGTAVGSDGAANQIGVAPDAQWIGCRNMDRGNGTPATYLECFEFFLAPYPVGGTPAQGDPTKAPHITNNSWICSATEGCAADTLRAAVEAQVAAGIFTVVSAGNNGSACQTLLYPPAFYAASYTVGALNTGTDTIAAFSSRGPVTQDGSNRIKPDIAAPGTNTRSSTPPNSYASISGTSMAAPHVAGAAALLLSARPDLIGDTDAIRLYLNGGAHHLPTSLCGGNGAWPNNVFGYGRANILASVRMALNPPFYLPLVHR